VSRTFKTGLLLAFGVALAGALAMLLIQRTMLTQPFDPHQSRFVGSEACLDCHRDRHESWYATYHRTMTQEASAESVQGKFDGQALDYWGVRMRPLRASGRYFFEYSDLQSGELIHRAEIVRTVGSHRYQQYMTYLPEAGSYVRLHYLWHNADKRWVHMNAAFLGPDEQGYDDQVAVWNQNCIFCHNTGPQPGMTNYDELVRRSAAGEPVDIVKDSKFQSSVAELGISCETCHGPGGEHVNRAQSWWTRMAMRLTSGSDASIVNPDALDARRSTQVCGQCHGQRTPLDGAGVRRWIHGGPTYRAGLDLDQHATPVWQQTRAPVEGSEDLFRLRFWGDGTPRLSAYEYQGVLQSACYQEAEMSCIDCHTVHGGDPAGQITERNRGNTPCLRCHQDYREEQALTAHTRHDAASEGSLCYNCHMPDAVYGVMDIHRTHHIESPDAVRDTTAGRPNACLNCHLDQSPLWLANELRQDPTAVVRADGADPTLSEAAAMLAGDPVQKAIIAYRAGQPGRHAGLGRAWLVPYLLEAMADKYPSSRRFAQQSLQQVLADIPSTPAVAALLDEVARFDFIADKPLRDTVLSAVQERWRTLDKSAWPVPPPASAVTSDYVLDETVRLALVELGARQDKQISIGE
jgi:predicted CXXCH cytochrome family protein